jgi:putative oxidoreductase
VNTGPGQSLFLQAHPTRMNRLLDTRYPAWAFNVSQFLLRIGLGMLLMPHGYDKLVHFNSYSPGFMDLLGLGGAVSLAMVVFAEFFCSLFLMIGLFTRLTVVPILIEMAVVVFKAHDGDVFGKGEMGALYLVGLLPILLCGPGKASVDGIMGK